MDVRILSLYYVNHIPATRISLFFPTRFGPQTVESHHTYSILCQRM